MASTSTLPLRETTDAELAEAVERMDAGCRLIVPMLYAGDRFDGLGADPKPGETEHLPIEDAPVTTVPEVEPDAAVLVGGELADARESIQGAGRALPLEGHMDLHLRFNVLINEIDYIGSVLAERHSS